MTEFVLSAKAELLDTVLNYIDARLSAAGCPMETRMLIGVAAEEIFVNICHYAYSRGGQVAIACVADRKERRMTLSFTDSGIPYNPLNREDPDTATDVDSRPIGGLGVYMAKGIMDSIRYEYKAGKNILTAVKHF